MSARTPVAHLGADGGCMVLGTHDIELARTIITAKLIDVFGEAEAAVQSDFEPRLEIGRAIPRNDGDGGWWWKPSFELGGRGVTRAVVWDS